MDFQSIAFQNTLLIILSALVIILAVQNIILQKRYKKIFKSNKGYSLEGVLKDYLKKVDKIEKDTEDLASNLLKIKEDSFCMIQKTAIKRYNPFSDTGSDQSFTISLLDGKNNGILLTGLHFREGVRVYAKPIENGQTKHQLSEEEAQVLKESLNK